MRFRLNEWNVEHLERHGVTPEEAERIVRLAKAPYPRPRADGRWLVWGRGDGGRMLQVLFVANEQDEVYVIHARPLTEREKHRFRRRKRS